MGTYFQHIEPLKVFAFKVWKTGGKINHMYKSCHLPLFVFNFGTYSFQHSSQFPKLWRILVISCLILVGLPGVWCLQPSARRKWRWRWAALAWKTGGIIHLIRRWVVVRTWWKWMFWGCWGTEEYLELSSSGGLVKISDLSESYISNCNGILTFSSGILLVERRLPGKSVFDETVSPIQVLSR